MLEVRGKRKKASGERQSKEPNQGGAEQATEVHKQMLPEQGKRIGRRCRTLADGLLKSVAEKVIMQRDHHHRRETRSKIK